MPTKNITIKKIITILALLLMPLIVANNANANMFNKFKKGFYFEKYKTAEDVRRALLERHPVGNDVDALIAKLEKAGARCESVFNKNEYGKFINCRYRQGYLLQYSWSVAVKISENHIGNIYTNKMMEVL